MIKGRHLSRPPEKGAIGDPASSAFRSQGHLYFSSKQQRRGKEYLADHTDRLGVEVLGIEPVDRDAIDFHTPLLRIIQPKDEVDACGLASSTVAHDGDQFSGTNGQAEEQNEGNNGILKRLQSCIAWPFRPLLRY